MNYDLKIIKDQYGEKMMHLCRELFPTLLENEGLLSSLLIKTFAPNKSLYDDIIEGAKLHTDTYERITTADYINWFKDYIYSLVDVEKKEIIETFKTPKELLSEAGYDLYECKTEEDIQSFKKYYAPAEELCTFKGGRLNGCYVFWVVRKDVDKIKREDFKKPSRDDLYGTSVMSIQFSKGKVNTLSIKSRYNHTVNNPDAALSNNLENIIPGLTESFERTYGLKINQNASPIFRLPNYVRANDGKYYKYNTEINNVYYCPNNIIIDNFEVKQLPKEKYIVMDYFIIDLVNKTIRIYDESIYDSFLDSLWNIKSMNIRKTERGKKIEIVDNFGKESTIEINKNNSIIIYENKNIRKIGDNFLYYCRNVEYLGLPKVRIIGRNFCTYNAVIRNETVLHNEFYLPKAIIAGENATFRLVGASFAHLGTIEYSHGRYYSGHPWSVEEGLIIRNIKKANRNISKKIREVILSIYKLKKQQERNNKKI